MKESNEHREILRAYGLEATHEFVFETRATEEVTGLNKHALERIPDLSLYANSNINLSSDIPPITEFPDGTPIRAYAKVVPMDELSVSLPLGPTEQAHQMYYPDVEAGELPEGTEWFSLAKGYIPQAVTEYVNRLEGGETKEWCKCPWIVHPEDMNLQEGECGYCGHQREDKRHNVGALTNSDELDAGLHRFQGRRIRRDLNNEHPQCPVHTKEGFILGFFEYLFKDRDEADDTSGT